MSVYNRQCKGWIFPKYEYSWTPVDPFRNEWSKMQDWVIRRD